MRERVRASRSQDDWKEKGLPDLLDAFEAPAFVVKLLEPCTRTRDEAVRALIPATVTRRGQRRVRGRQRGRAGGKEASTSRTRCSSMPNSRFRAAVSLSRCCRSCVSVALSPWVVGASSSRGEFGLDMVSKISTVSRPTAKVLAGAASALVLVAVFPRRFRFCLPGCWRRPSDRDLEVEEGSASRPAAERRHMAARDDRLTGAPYNSWRLEGTRNRAGNARAPSASGGAGWGLTSASPGRFCADGGQEFLRLQGEVGEVARTPCGLLPRAVHRADTCPNRPESNSNRDFRREGRGRLARSEKPVR